MVTPKELVLLTALAVFFCSVILLLIILPRLKARKVQQMILDIGPQWHKSKEGTPTMGGIAPALACGVVCLLCLLLPGEFSPSETVGLTLTVLFALGSGAVGVVDDLTKFRHHRNGGLTPMQKLVLQVAICGAYLAIMLARGLVGHSLPVPFTSVVLSLGPFYLPLMLLFAVGTVNFANLTDGIDGLASSVNMIVGGFYVVAGIVMGKNDLVCLAAAMMASAFAFLLFNYHPARIFMGDTGSLFFGAMAVGCGMLSGRPLLLLFPGIVYYLEGASVILQVAWFKISRGKRLFKMAPLHHHLEKSGFCEEKIVFVMTLLTLIMSVAAAFSL